MVVSLSLPLPSVDSCRLLVNQMNQELATVLDDVRDEWSPRNLKPSEIALSEELAKIGDLPTTDSGVTEESFSRILDEFAIEALRPAIEEAANHARTIPVEQANHPLPPAVEAIDALPSALELIRAVSQERDAVSVVSDSPLWNEIVSDRLTEQAEVEFVVEMVQPVHSDDIGPWQWLEEEIAEKSRTSDRFDETLKDSRATAHAADSISEEWDRVIRLVDIADAMTEIEFPAPIEPAQATPIDDTKKVTIQDAFRKTAEAIALWSKVMTRAF